MTEEFPIASSKSLEIVYLGQFHPCSEKGHPACSSTVASLPGTLSQNLWFVEFQGPKMKDQLPSLSSPSTNCIIMSRNGVQASIRPKYLDFSEQFYLVLSTGQHRREQPLSTDGDEKISVVQMKHLSFSSHSILNGY